jgi:hypothetical protein
LAVACRPIAVHLDVVQAKADAVRAAQLEMPRELDARMPSSDEILFFSPRYSLRHVDF